MADRLEGSDMEAREPRREVIKAEGRVLRDGEIATIRHRAVVRDDGQSQVFSIRLVEDPHGQYTEDGEIWSSGDGSRWRGRTPPNGWDSEYGSFEDVVGHYRWLRTKPDGWWGSSNVALLPTYLDAQRWQREHEIEGQPVRHRIYTDDQGEGREEWGILTRDGYEA